MSMVRRLRRWIVAGSLIGSVGLLMATPAFAQEPTLDGVRVSGAPVVGSALTAVISGSIDPADVSFKWCREGDRAGKCAQGAPVGFGVDYVPLIGDVGSRLIVVASATIGTFTVEVRSTPSTPVVAAPPPPPDPLPGPSPEPTAGPVPEPVPAVTATPDLTAPAPTFTSPGVTPAGAVLGASDPVVVGPAALRYMSPFPVVRIRGSLAAGGARVSMLNVTAPRAARVSVRCEGRGCPSIRRRSRAPGRVRALERFLIAGTRITIRVRRPSYIGKYTRITIRAGRPPSRRDACLMPGSSRPARCPPA